MKPSLVATVLALLAAAGCQSGGRHMNDHWNSSSIVPRATRFFLGYDAEKDGTYRDFAWERKQSINMTLRRHLLNHNPDNPYHLEVPSRFEPRPVNSLLPNPINYIHLEGILLGFAATGAGGAFFPLPIDSIMGSLEQASEGGKSGREEFMEGIEYTAGQTIGTVTATFAHKWIEPSVGGVVTRVHRLID